MIDLLYRSPLLRPSTAELKESEPNDGKKCRLEIHAELNRWEKEGPRDEQRDIAVRRIKDSFDRETSYLDLSGLGLRSLPILPLSLRMIVLDNNRLTSDIVLPANLEKLLMANNLLESLPAFGISMRHLDVRGNLLASISDLSYAEQLETLLIGDNKLESMPTVPESIRHLDASGNAGIAIPDMSYARQLETLVLRRNKLDSWPAIPASIRHIDVYDNEFISIPDLSYAHLETLVIGKNALESLPMIPVSTQHLDAGDNLLAAIPDLSYAKNLQDIDLSDNALTEIPGSLLHVRKINLQTNCISEVEERIREMPLGNRINLKQNPLSEASRLFLRRYVKRLAKLPEYRKSLAEWRPAGTNSMLDQHRAENGEMTPGWDRIIMDIDSKVKVFFGFLSRLRKTSNAESRGFRDRIWTLLERIAASPNLRKAAFDAAWDATESCSDRILQTLTKMEMACLGDDVREGRYDGRIPELIEAARKVFRNECLDEIAVQKINALVAEKMAAPLNNLVLVQHGLTRVALARMNKDDLARWVRATIDDIEIRLAYSVMLPKLELNSTVKHMQYAHCAELSSRDLKAAEQRVMRQENETFHQWLTAWEPWQAAMERVEPELCEEATAAAYSISEDFDYEREIDEKIRKDGLWSAPDIPQLVDAEIRKRGVADEPGVRRRLHQKIVLQTQIEKSDIRTKLKSDIMNPWLDDIKLELTERFAAKHNCAEALKPLWKKVAPAPAKPKTD